MPERKEIAKQIIAALFFIGGIILATLVILSLGKEKGFVQPKFQVTVIYRNVAGLIEGSPIQLAGVHVGNVSKIDFLEKSVDGRRVEVVMNVFTKYKKQLELNASFAIRTEGVLGEKIVEISVNEQGPPTDLSKPIKGVDPIDVQDIAESFAKAAESFTATSNALNEIKYSELADVLSQTAKSLQHSSRAVNLVLDELVDVSRKTKRILDRLEQQLIEGDLFKVF